MKKVNKADIISRLINRFKLTEAGEYQPLLLSETIVPVTDVDRALRKPKAQSTTDASVTAATTHTYTVPVGKIWTLKKAMVITAIAKNYTLYLNIDGTDYTFDSPQANITGLGYDMLGILLKANDSFKVTLNAGTAGGYTTSIFYEEEDLF